VAPPYWAASAGKTTTKDSVVTGAVVMGMKAPGPDWISRLASMSLREEASTAAPGLSRRAATACRAEVVTMRPWAGSAAATRLARGAMAVRAGAVAAPPLGSRTGVTAGALAAVAARLRSTVTGRMEGRGMRVTFTSWGACQRV